MNKREALIAMAEGKKIMSKYWLPGDYLYQDPDTGRLLCADGESGDLEFMPNDDVYEIYTPPKQKKVVYPALFKDTMTGGYIVSHKLFESVDCAKEWMPAFICLLMDRGVEVEE